MYKCVRTVAAKLLCDCDTCTSQQQILVYQPERAYCYK